MNTKPLSPKMVEALAAAAAGHNAPNMHGTYKALRTRGLVEYVWGQPNCWVITPEGATMAKTTTTPDLTGWIIKDGVRHDENHSLRINGFLAPGIAQKRQFRCICGHDFGSLYDGPAMKAYRAHRKAAA